MANIGIRKAVKKSTCYIFVFFIIAVALVFLNILKPVIFSMIIDEGLIKADWSIIKQNCFYFLMLSTFIAIFSGLHHMLASLISNNMVTEIKQAITTHIFNLRYDFFDKKRTGDIVTRIDDDTEHIQDYLMSILYVAMEGFLGFFSAMIYIGYVQWRMVVVGFLVLPFLWGVLHLFRKKIQSSNEMAQEAYARTNEQLIEGLSHILYLRQIALDSRKLGEISKCLIKEKKTSINRDIWSGLNDSSSSFVLALGYIVMIGYGGWLVTDQQLSIGHLFAFITLRSRFLAPMNFVQIVYKGFFATKISVKRIADIFEFSTEKGLAGRTNKTMMGQIGSVNNIQFKSLTFRYGDKKEKGIFREISPLFNTGWHGILGENGTGKTTLTWLILKLLEPTDGGIWINGKIDLSKLNNREWRESISILPQHTYLFSGSLRENIRIFNPKVSDDDIITILKELNFDSDFLETLGGLDKFIVDGGKELSGGQIQKIAIARMVLKDAPIYILDEPFSHIDIKSKNVILRCLKKRLVHSIVIVISHDDMSTYVDYLHKIKGQKVIKLEGVT